MMDEIILNESQTPTFTDVAQTVHFDSNMIARAPILNAQTKVHLALGYVQWKRAFHFPFALAIIAP